MRIGRLQINWNKAPKKVDRDLKLEHFYTFRDGTNIYTYQVNDLARISGRYLDGVKTTLSFMLQYSAGPEQVKAFSKNISDRLYRVINEPDVRKCKEAIIEAHEISKRMPKLQDYVEDLHKKHWMDLYVMFFVLEGEKETLFSPKWNQKKIELLEQEAEEVQEVFFSMLQTIIVYFSDTYRKDLISSMVQERELTHLAETLNTYTQSAMSNPDILQKSADGQAQT